MHKDYQALKDAAWSGVMRSLRVTNRLTSGAQKKLESQFEDIRRIDFTLTNIEGFLWDENKVSSLQIKYHP
jgi:hypothetical protein